jgi:hypothetical protein
VPIPEGYTRVTEILSIFQAYSFVKKDVLKRCQDIGTDVHEAIECFFRYGFKPLDAKKSLYFDSFLKWVDKCQKIEPVMLETRLYDHKAKITGKLDLLCDMDGLRVLVDFKTGSWAHPEIWRLQACFYRAFIEDEWLENDGPEMPNHFLFVQLQKDGSDPILYPMEYDPKDWEVCKAALHCYKYFKNPTHANGEC